MTLALQRWHTQSALKAETAAVYLRPVCGRFAIEVESANPNLDSSPPSS